ncbi:MAG: hypothetical protein U9Q82_06235 [Chloroflexota bacterium]|nr:hypothetical protein [Chloroflexota bacterium]
MRIIDNNQYNQSGQGLVEYALILVLVALVVLVVLAAMGSGIEDSFKKLPFFSGDEDNPILSTKDDFLARIQAFYDENGRWPRSWGDYAYTDIGLDPDDWNEPVEGIYWGPHGDDVGLANRHGDNLEVYVDDLQGDTLHLYNGWNIWCPVSNEHCYYHNIAPGNEVDLSTLVVIEE